MRTDTVTSQTLKARTDRPCALIVGVGDVSGIGGAVALRCAQGGLPVFIVGRTASKLQHVVDAIVQAGGQATAVINDLADAVAVEKLFAAVEASGHAPELVVFNAASLNVPQRFLPVSARQFEDKWQLTGMAGILVAQAAARRMVTQGHGSILITGATASMRGKPLFATFASAKAVLRSFAASLAWEVAPRGVHVTHIVIDGMVAGHRARSALGGLGNLMVWYRGQEGCLQPAEVAEAYWQMHQQTAGAWTHEADLRPFKESF
jgi:short-subunit dehydrogenase